MSLTLSRRGALGLAVGGLATGLATSAAAGPVDDLARSVVAEGKSPSISVAIMRSGTLVHQVQVGQTNLENGTAADPGSVYRIGSLTKQFTGAAVLALAEEGRLTLDDTLDRFLPDFPRASEVSLRRLLNHTSGLGNYTDMPTLDAFMQAARLDYDEAELLAMTRAQEPLYIHEPGSAWAYSNSGYLLLGFVVAKASGESYGDYLARRLLGPAGLASIREDATGEIVPGRVHGYTPEPATPSGYANASFISMTFPGGGGSLRGTALDLCRWHQELLFGSILKPESLAEMVTPATLADGALAFDDDKGLLRSSSYGLGISVAPDQDGQGRTFSHTGGIQGFISRLTTLERPRLSIAILANCDGGFGEPTGLREANRAIEAAALSAYT